MRTLIFFGAPHNGLEVTALETLVKGRPTQTLISELKRESPTLTGLSERFRHVAKDMTIHTYYESRPTSTVDEGPDGHWERRGEPKVMVERSSALLNLEAEKTRMKVDGDHKEIARLRRGQGGVYPNVLRIIKEALVSASDQFAATLSRQAYHNAVQAADIEAEEGRQAYLKAVSEAEAEGRQFYTKAAQAAEIEAEEALAVKPDPGVRFDRDTTQDVWGYGDYNLVCDSCYNEFPRTQEHQHCYICRNGNYNVCQFCNALGDSCPGGHHMVSRQLEDSRADDEGKEGDGTRGWCDCCAYKFLDYSLFFTCVICSGGTFAICINCRKSGRICVTGHKLLKPQVLLGKANNAMPETMMYCIIPGCSCGRANLSGISGFTPTMAGLTSSQYHH